MPAWTEALLGLAVGLLLSMAMIRWVGPLGWMDRPDATRKKHSHPIARTGGLALWAVLTLAQVTGRVPFHLHGLDWAGIHLMALVGLLDDRFNLRPRYKALAGFIVSMVLAWHGTVSLARGLEQVPFLGLTLPTHPVVIAPLLTLWFWAIPQAYNLIDGINGLSLGLGALLLGVLGWSLGAHSALLWGGLIAALLLNYPKARHFMGDCGALLLGTFFAILGMEAFAVKDPDLLFWVFAYPTIDVCLVVGIRGWKGLPLGGADRSHLHHWMMDRLEGRSWIATPVLLALAGLPMLRATALPGHLLLSTLGLGALLFVALKAFKDRVVRKGRTSAAATGIRREVPFMASRAVREISGSHPKL